MIDTFPIPLKLYFILYYTCFSGRGGGHCLRIGFQTLHSDSHVWALPLHTSLCKFQGNERVCSCNRKVYISVFNISQLSICSACFHWRKKVTGVWCVLHCISVLKRWQFTLGSSTFESYKIHLKINQDTSTRPTSSAVALASHSLSHRSA